jgi:glutaredoxin
MFRSHRIAQLMARALLLALPTLGGCHEKAHPDPSTDTAAPKPAELPPLQVKADTPNLLITWIDDKGDFHVVDKPAGVPVEARKTVRVVVADKEAGTGEQVYVADLNETAADGSYRIKTMSRAAWDELGASKRKARLEALAPPTAPATAPSAAGSAAIAKAPSGSIVVIIYGASWCKPCHDAEAYLRQRGVNVIKKDIEENEAAASEMKQKLDRAGKGGASIPVIDVMGRILVGFSPASLDRALEAARGTKPL